MIRPAAADLIRLLDLEPLEPEGGYFRETYRAAGPGRAASTAIYYLLTPASRSLIHRLPQDEIFHFYLGHPVEQLLLRPDGAGEVRLLGPDVAAGMLPQAMVPGRWWQGARLRPGGEFALMGTTVAPGFDPAEFELGMRGPLLEAYPAFSGLIRSLTAQ